MKKLIGQIIIPPHTFVNDDEYEVAEVLAQFGDNVYFLPPAAHHTPDLVFQNQRWEIKTPRGQSSRTIENNIRTALKQSDHIIIYLKHTKLREQQSLRDIKRQSSNSYRVKKMMVITKKQKLLVIK